jgi:hypothetical protein
MTTIKILFLTLLVFFNSNNVFSYCNTDLTTLCDFKNVDDCQNYCLENCGHDDPVLFLTCAHACEEYDIEYENCFGDTENQCPASISLNGNREKLDRIRNFRDQVLKQSQSGQLLIDIYYKTSKSASAILKNSPALKKASGFLLELFLNILQ